MRSITQFVNQKTCLKCKGCCRYGEQESVFRPNVLLDKEIHPLTAHADEEQTMRLDATDDDGYIRAIPKGEEYLCALLEPEDYLCEVYQSRPFECMLYPFVVLRCQGRVVVCAHLGCPDIHERMDTPEFRKYVEMLEGFFNNAKIRDFLKEHSDDIGEYEGYSDEFKECFTIDFE